LLLKKQGAGFNLEKSNFGIVYRDGVAEALQASLSIGGGG
jgi:hypothetical protein